MWMRPRHLLCSAWSRSRLPSLPGREEGEDVSVPGCVEKTACLVVQIIAGSNEVTLSFQLLLGICFHSAFEIMVIRLFRLF